MRSVPAGVPPPRPSPVDEWDESHRANILLDRFTVDPPNPQELLATGLGPDRDDQAATLRQLLPQRGGTAGSPAVTTMASNGASSGHPSVPIAADHVDVVVAQRTQAPTGLVGEDHPTTIRGYAPNGGQTAEPQRDQTTAAAE